MRVKLRVDLTKSVSAMKMSSIYGKIGKLGLVRCGVADILGFLIDRFEGPRRHFETRRGERIVTMRMTILAGLGFAVLGAVAQAQEIPALTISPDGTTLLVAGSNRVIYTVDAATLEVSDRRYYPEQVRWARYSSDGETVFLRTQDRKFSAVSAGSFKERFGADKIVAVSYAADSGRIALLENNYKGGVLHVLRAGSGKRMTTIEFPELRTDDVALDPSGDFALLLTNSETSDAEEKAQPGSDLKGYDKNVFRQQHDGYISKLVSVDLNAGTFDVAETWYRVSSPSQVRILNGKMALVNNGSDSGLVAEDGSAQLMNLGDKYVSHSRISDDGKTILLTNNVEIRIHSLIDGASISEVGQTVEADRLPGPGERVTAVAEAADGTLYMGTSAYRVIRVDADGGNLTVAPVF